MYPPRHYVFTKPVKQLRFVPTRGKCSVMRRIYPMSHQGWKQTAGILVSNLIVGVRDEVSDLRTCSEIFLNRREESRIFPVNDAR